MKKFIIVLFLFVLSTFVFAQDSKWTVSILPGYQLNELNKTEVTSDGASIVFSCKKEAVASVDVAYRITEHYGLHLAYFHNDSEYDKTVYYYYTSGPVREKNPVTIFEIGPEWQFKFLDKGEFYVQLNMGRTFSSTNESNLWYWDHYHSYKCRTNTWTLGSAFGLRYFFTPNCGAAVQIGYHYLDNWWYSPLWDARAGLVFRF